jgi:hypothetical protein
MSEIFKDSPTGQRFGKYLQWKDLFPVETVLDREMIAALADGLRRGIERCVENGLGDHEQHRQTAERTIELLNQAQLPRPQWTSRGTTLFVELLTIGTCVRLVNNQPPVTAEDVTQHATWTEDIALC